MYPNQESTGATVNVKPAFNQFALGFSVFLFICIFTYWFADANSPASLVNLLLNKADNHDKIFDFPKQYLWARFYLHLVVTAVALLIYVRSGFTNWLGSFISEQYFMEKFFHSYHRRAANAVVGAKIFIAIILLLKAYALVMGIVAAELPPTGQGSIIILLVLLLTAIWHVKRVEAVEYPYMTGPLNSMSKRLWFRLSNRQFAYVQEAGGGSRWLLYEDNAYIDLSYTECYLFLPETFNIQIDDKVMTKDLIGSVKYSVRSDINTKELPGSLSTAEVLKLYNVFTEPDELDRLIYMLVDDDGLLVEAKDNMLIAAQEYFNIDQNIFMNNTTKNRNDLERILKSRTDFRPIDKKIEELINKESEALTGSSKLLKLSFKISDAEFKMDDMLKEVLASQRSTAERVTHGNIDVQEKTFDTILASSTNPAFNKSKVDILLGLATKLNQSFSQEAKPIASVPEPQMAAIANPVKIASEQVVNAILEVMENEPNADVIAEAVSGSTSFISEHNIPVSDFVKRYFQKLEAERMERSYEAYRQLAEDTLTELMPGK